MLLVDADPAARQPLFTLAEPDRLPDMRTYFHGFHLYYPHKRQASPAFSAFVDAVRYRGER